MPIETEAGMMAFMNLSALYDYWFGPLASTPIYLQSRMKLWFGKDDTVDAYMRKNFAPLLDHPPAVTGARDLIASVVLLDQVPRNSFRGAAQAFAYDPRARKLCFDGMANGNDLQLHPVERTFFYLPLEHSEDRDHQAMSVKKFETLAREAPEDLKPFLENALEYAIAHRKIIDRFGRFPHRNVALGRTSTPQEIEFLKEPGSSF